MPQSHIHECSRSTIIHFVIISQEKWLLQVREDTAIVLLGMTRGLVQI